MIVRSYKGYNIASADQAGGKAGRGFAKTSTIQVREPFNSQGDYLLLKQIRFKIGPTKHDTAVAVRAAIVKATKFIDGVVATKQAEEEARKAAEERVVTS